MLDQNTDRMWYKRASFRGGSFNFYPRKKSPTLSEAKVGDEFRSSDNLKLFLKTFSY